MGSFNARTLININSGRLFAKEKETVGIESDITSASTQQLDLIGWSGVSLPHRNL